MAEQYWIGEFFVDLSRNQITQNKQPQTLAPKALAVLTCLAKHHGQVVSQDTLLETVWPDTIVSTNTLQRCIAQLRKALGDDGKVQVYIKTHAKKGYSLECAVQWDKPQEVESPSSPEVFKQKAPEVLNQETSEKIEPKTHATPQVQSSDNLTEAQHPVENQNQEISNSDNSEQISHLVGQISRFI